MNLIVDIDDTLWTTKLKRCDKCGAVSYTDYNPIQTEIDMVNLAYDAGYTIILHTGRNWDKYQFTKAKLKDFNIRYHQLVMGKPQGLYIDKTNNFNTIKEAIESLNNSGIPLFCIQAETGINTIGQKTNFNTVKEAMDSVEEQTDDK